MSTRHQLLYDDIRSTGDHRKHILLGAGDTEISVGMQGNNLNSSIIDVSFMNIDVSIKETLFISYITSYCLLLFNVFLLTSFKYSHDHRNF